MKINLAVCGRFHYHNYVPYLQKKGVLGTFYFSHKLETGRKLSIPSDFYYNAWLKEYLLHFHSRKFKGIGKYTLYPFYHKIWEQLVLWNWKPADLLHVMIHGTSVRLIKRAKRDKSIVIGEAVNTHPYTMNRLLQEEYDRLGIKMKVYLTKAQEKQLEEIQLIDHLLAPSEFVRNSFIEHGFDANKITVIHYGANLTKFYKDKNVVKDDIFRVLCVSQISIRKGHIDILRAWEKLNLKHAELIFIGALEAELESIMKKYSKDFTYLGMVPNDQLVHYYNKADAFVLASIEEGCSIVPLEAMACGLPVVLSDHTGSHELIVDGEDGYVFRARDTQQLETILSMLYENRSVLEVLGQRCLNKVAHQSNWDEYGARLIDCYQRILEDAKRTA
jgi:glycosyltransferase involved in cell wall biosynthesis